MSAKDSIAIQPERSVGESESSQTAQYKINYYGADFTLEVLSMKINRNEIVIPRFQRRYIWPITRASKLVESFLLGSPVPEVFLYREEKTQDLLIVDGHQRLKTISYFFSETFEDGRPFRLRGVKAAWEGKKFSELKSTEQRYLRTVFFEQPSSNRLIPKIKLACLKFLIV